MRTTPPSRWTATCRRRHTPRWSHPCATMQTVAKRGNQTDFLRLPPLGTFGHENNGNAASDLRIQSGLFLRSSEGYPLNRPECASEIEEQIQIQAGHLFSCSHSCETSLTFLGGNEHLLPTAQLSLAGHGMIGLPSCLVFFFFSSFSFSSSTYTYSCSGMPPPSHQPTAFLLCPRFFQESSLVREFQELLL